MQKMITMIAVACLFLLAVTTSHLYAADCASAAIKRVGANPSASTAAGSPYMVQLDCSDDSKWSGTVQFFLSADLGESGLATLLTAYSLDKSIWVRTLGTASGSIVSVIYVND